jgi:lycopene cyclase domain-containing protein
MTYAALLFFFGVIPIALLWLNWPRLVRRHTGSLLIIVILIMLVSIPWEMVAVGRIWYYSPRVIWGPRLFNLPVEELAFYVIDGLFVGTLALLLGKEERC